MKSTARVSIPSALFKHFAEDLLTEEGVKKKRRKSATRLEITRRESLVSILAKSGLSKDWLAAQRPNGSVATTVISDAFPLKIDHQGEGSWDFVVSFSFH